MINSIIQNSFDNPEDYIVGFADLVGLNLDLPFRFGIVIGKRLDDNIINAIDKGPTLEYFNYYQKINSELSELIHNIKRQIMNTGYDCRVVEPSNNGKDRNDENYELTLRTPISHKLIATRAGLGWIGKTDLFISKKFGPRLRLVSLLTNYPVDITAIPVDKSKCGKCEICVVNCPANAATGQLWDTYTDRDVFFDAHKCRNKCRELTKKFLDLDLAICGICISVCPIGKSKFKM
jgi:epoxyqueuosine reductase